MSPRGDAARTATGRGRDVDGAAAGGWHHRRVRVDLPLVATGKVRAIYDAGPEHLLLVTSDRISAFDVVMANGIPDKGRVLNRMSAFWFQKLAHISTVIDDQDPWRHIEFPGTRE